MNTQLYHDWYSMATRIAYSVVVVFFVLLFINSYILQQPKQLAATPKPDELEAKSLYDNVHQILENLTDYEFELARQSPLPDSFDSLAKQMADFEQFASRVTDKALFFNGVIDRTKEFCSNPLNEASRLRIDLVNYSNEAAYRLKMVISNKQVVYMKWVETENGYTGRFDDCQEINKQP